jgi:hypothetical protein
MRFRSTWILLGLLVAVVAYFLLVERHRGARDDGPGGAGTTLLPYGPEEVERIVLVNPAKERIVVERRGDEEWMITRPTVTRAAVEMIDVLLMQLVPGIKLEEFRDVPDPGDFGFDAPYATVILSAHGRARPDTITAGDTVPTSPRCYVRLGSSRTVVITRELTHGAVDKSLYDLRDKNLLDAGIDEIDGLTVMNGPSLIELSRKNGEWLFTASGLRADRLVIESSLLALTTAIIHAFAREDLTGLASFGLINPPRRLIVDAGGRRISLSFGASDPRMVYVVRSGLDKVLQVPADLLRIFALGPSAFRAKDLSLADPAAVSRLSAESNGGTVLLVKRDGSWRFTAPAPAAAPSAAADTASSTAVGELLGALVSMKFEEVFDPAAAPPEVRGGTPAITFVLWDGQDRVIDEIMVASSTEGFEIGSSTSTAAVGRLKRGSVERISRLLSRLGG